MIFVAESKHLWFSTFASPAFQTQRVGHLLKRSNAFPHPWQQREVRVTGGALFYVAGSGMQKGLSLHEILTIRMTDHECLCEFEVSARHKTLLFRAADKDSAIRWVTHLQQLHHKATTS